MLAPGTHRLVKRIVGPGRAEFDAIILPEAGDRGLIKDHLGNRRQFHRRELFDRALIGRIKAARAVEHIAKEVEPHRAIMAGREDVDDAAANGIVARLHHRGRLRKAHADKEILERALVDPLAHPRGKGRLAQHAARGDALRGGVERGQEHERSLEAGRERRERRHARGRDVGIGRDPVIRQAIPAGKIQHHGIGGKERQRRAHRGEPLVVTRHMDDGRALFQFAREKQRVESLRRTAGDDMYRSVHARFPRWNEGGVNTLASDHREMTGPPGTHWAGSCAAPGGGLRPNISRPVTREIHPARGSALTEACGISGSPSITRITISPAGAPRLIASH